jgi:predicted oxidoreductase (fatty acid repression mutant protein)
LGNLEKDSFTGNFERWMKRSVGMQHLSLKRLCGRGLGGELLHWGPCVGNVVLRRRPQSTFCVRVRPNLTQIYISGFLILDP